MLIVQSLRVFVAFFCQKAILTLVFAAFPAAALFDAGAAIGAPELFRTRRSLAALGALLLIVLLTGFLRDARDLESFGLRAAGVDSFFAYALRCEVGASVVALPFALRLRRPSVAVLLALATLAGAAAIDLLAFPAFGHAGALLGAVDWSARYHVIEAAVFVAVVAALVAGPKDEGVTACLWAAIVSAAQGALAYHGVSALSIVVCAAVAWATMRSVRRAVTSDPP